MQAVDALLDLFAIGGEADLFDNLFRFGNVDKGEIGRRVQVIVRPFAGIGAPDLAAKEHIGAFWLQLHIAIVRAHHLIFNLDADLFPVAQRQREERLGIGVDRFDHKAQLAAGIPVGFLEQRLGFVRVVAVLRHIRPDAKAAILKDRPRHGGRAVVEAIDHGLAIERPPHGLAHLLLDRVDIEEKGRVG